MARQEVEKKIKRDWAQQREYWIYDQHTIRNLFVHCTRASLPYFYSLTTTNDTDRVTI